MKIIALLACALVIAVSTCALCEPLAPASTPVFGPYDETQVSIGYQALDVDGSLGKFTQYNTPPSGLYLDSLGYVGKAGADAARLNAWIIDEANQNGELWYYPYLNSPPGSVLRAATNYNEFSDRRDLFPILTPFFGASRRNAWASYWLAGGQTGRGLQFGVNTSSRDSSDPALHLPDYGFTDLFGRAVGTRGQWGLDGLGAYSLFTDATGSLFDSRIGRLRFFADRPVGSRSSLAVGFRGDHGKKLPGQTGYVRALNFAQGSVDYVTCPTDTLSVRANLMGWSRNQPITENNYGKSLVRASLDGKWSPVRKMYLSAGYQANYVRYLKVAENMTFRPNYSILRGRFRYSPTQRLDIWGNYRRRVVSDSPPDKLIPTEVETAEGRLYYAVTDTLFFEGARSRNRVQNPFRGVDYWLDTTTLILTSPLTRKLSAIADYNSYNWTSGSTVLDLFVTDSKVGSIGLLYLISPDFTARFGVGFRNNTPVIDESRDYWYIEAQRRLDKDRSLGFRISRSQYDDDTFGFNSYTADGLLFTLTNKF